jgi:hypothetical protein
MTGFGTFPEMWRHWKFPLLSSQGLGIERLGTIGIESPADQGWRLPVWSKGWQIGDFKITAAMRCQLQTRIFVRNLLAIKPPTDLLRKPISLEVD